MEQPKLTPDRAELIVNLLRDNPGASVTLADIADETGLAVEDLAAYLEDLVSHDLVIHQITPDGFDVYRLPDEYQRGSTGPSSG